MSDHGAVSPRSRARRAGVARAAMLAATLALAGCGAWSASAAPVTVLIGVDVDLASRGPGVAYGNAVRLMTEQINKRELAGPGRRVELRMLDNRGDPALSAQNLSTLAADPAVVAVITAGCTGCVIDAAG